MIKSLNCPNCGAPIVGDKCEYCGTVFLDFAAIQVGAPSFVKFKIGDAYILTRLVVDSLEVNPITETMTFHDGLGSPMLSTVRSYGCDFHLDAHAVVGPEESLLAYIEK